ncbi:MAG: M23 family metallopeptidase [Deltaproteobacteria bacterium]|jgi:murein DD-endopeptidase MepM/ murein hydrolase activator NlpD|nr:M23 family metallopeptidase [Deltaproteobacteria bacterium]
MTELKDAAERGQALRVSVVDATSAGTRPDYSSLIERFKEGDLSRVKALERKLKAEAQNGRPDAPEAPLELAALGEEVIEGQDSLDLSSLEGADEKGLKTVPLSPQGEARPEEMSGPEEGGPDSPKQGSGGRKSWLAAAAAVLALVITWQLLSSREAPPPDEGLEVSVTTKPPEEVLVEPELPPGPMSLDKAWRKGLTVDSYVIEKGGTISQALEKLSLPQARRRGLYQLLERESLLTQVKPGEEFQAWWSDPARSDDSLERLEFRARPGDRPLVFIPSGTDGFIFFNTAGPAKKIHQATEGVVADSFWAACEKAGLEPWVILHIVDLMASQVDFVSDIRQGDDFQLLFLGEYQEGRLIAKPVIEMIRMTNDAKKYEFYRHQGDDGQEGYYDAQFKSIFKTFFKSPLQYSRISSGFSRARRHPILKIVRPHLGVDYAAPQGTPVSAVADGVVRSAGFRGDYGRLVVLDHDGEYRTMYGHLSKIEKGLAPGVKVRQGDLLGNVGMSGLATGPHLDFRILHKGQFVDPEEVIKVQEGKPLPADERTRFAESVTRDQDLLKRLLEGS